ASTADDVVLKNPIPALNKKCFALNNRVLQGFCCSLPLGTHLLDGKIFLIRARLGCSREMDQKIDASVTTRHVFWPNQRRRVAWLLPIWIRNSAVLTRGYDQQVPRGAGGVQPAVVAEIGRSKTSHEILFLLFPYPVLV